MTFSYGADSDARNLADAVVRIAARAAAKAAASGSSRVAMRSSAAAASGLGGIG